MDHKHKGDKMRAIRLIPTLLLATLLSGCFTYPFIEKDRGESENDTKFQIEISTSTDNRCGTQQRSNGHTIPVHHGARYTVKIKPPQAINIHVT
jgi:starvation-inducible outer membrane lipoprotein